MSQHTRNTLKIHPCRQEGKRTSQNIKITGSAVFFLNVLFLGLSESRTEKGAETKLIKSWGVRVCG